MVHFYDRIFRNSPNIQMLITYVDDNDEEQTITNTNICREEMSLDEALCSDDNLMFGTCESSCFYIRVANIDDISFKGRQLDVVMSLPNTSNELITDAEEDIVNDDDDDLIYYEDDSETLYIPIGKFRVVSDKPTADRVWRDLVCYDLMYDIRDTNVVDWYNGLTFPISIKNLRDSLFTELGISQETTTLINDSYMVTGDFTAAGELSAITILEAICELNGVFGHINRYGVFTYVSLPSTDSLAYPFYVNGTGVYEDYVTEAITGITAVAEEGDSGTIVGTDSNMYKIMQNPLTYGQEGEQTLTTALTNLLNHVSQFTYRPFAVTTYGNPMIPLGMSISFKARGNKTISSFVMKRNLRGIQALRDDFTATGDETYPEFINPIKNEITRLNGKTHVLRNDVNELNSEINDEGTGIKSQLQQTNDEIVLKVDTSGNIVQVKLGVDKDDPSATTFKVGADNISFIANDKIELTTNNLEINSTYFQVDSTGHLVCTSGNIGGYSISGTYIKYGDITSMSDTSHTGLILTGNGLRTNYFYPLGDYEYTLINNGKIQTSYVDTNYLDVGEDLGGAANTVLMANYSGCYSSLYGVSIWYGGLDCRGTKNRLIETEDYGERLLYCYETATPMFGDIGEGQIAEDGKCYIWLDPTFAQTITEADYQVFLQNYGPGNCYVTERKSNYFIVEGEAGLVFGWEIKARQKDFNNYRLETSQTHKQGPSFTNYGKNAANHIQEIKGEREVA